MKNIQLRYFNSYQLLGIAILIWLFTNVMGTIFHFAISFMPLTNVYTGGLGIFLLSLILFIGSLPAIFLVNYALVISQKYFYAHLLRYLLPLVGGITLLTGMTLFIVVVHYLDIPVFFQQELWVPSLIIGFSYFPSSILTTYIVANQCYYSH